MAWFLIQSSLSIVTAFVLGLIVGWLWWGRPWRKIPFTESQAVQTVAQRLENLIADRDAEIVRLRERTTPDGPVRMESPPDDEVAETSQAAADSSDLPDTDTPQTAPAPETTSPDDLERIEGVGPRISAALHEAGIDTYHALAQAEEEQLRGVLREAGLSFAPSLVTWSQQATLLATGDEDAFRAFTSKMMRRPRRLPQQHPTEAPEQGQAESADAAAPKDAPDPLSEVTEDDLERVEGIGPRISKALHTAGIHSYRKLADSDVPALKTALEDAGLRFAPSLPTWPRQAAFLADDDEEGVEAFTNTLVGGRDSGRKA